MTALISIILVLGAFIGMEGVAWFTHKYIMHGILWSWHESHHRPHKGFFEKNDLFSVVFSGAAILMIVIGLEVKSVWFLFPLGIGVTLYGLSYFIFHDVLVHRRIKFKWKIGSHYLLRMIRIHKIHHKRLEKEGCEAFGFLYAHSKYKNLMKQR